MLRNYPLSFFIIILLPFMYSTVDLHYQTYLIAEEISNKSI